MALTTHQRYILSPAKVETMLACMEPVVKKG